MMQAVNDEARKGKRSRYKFLRAIDIFLGFTGRTIIAATWRMTDDESVACARDHSREGVGADGA